jgi:G3E family GTPase
MLERRALRRPGRRTRPPVHVHRHGQLVAASFVDLEPLAAEPLLAMLEEMAPRLMRAKGFVHLAGEPRRGYLELASGRVSLTFGAAWEPAEDRRSELVIIGDGVSDPELRRRMWACRASG